MQWQAWKVDIPCILALSNAISSSFSTSKLSILVKGLASGKSVHSALQLAVFPNMLRVPVRYVTYPDGYKCSEHISRPIPNASPALRRIAHRQVTFREDMSAQEGFAGLSRSRAQLLEKGTVTHDSSDPDPLRLQLIHLRLE